MIAKTIVSLLLALAFSSCPSALLAQSQTTGRISGTVQDQNGAAIARAEVTAINLATEDERKVVTDSEGNYSVLLLPPGLYRVSIRATGFKRAFIENVPVIITQTTVEEAKLEVGELKESVTINTAPSLIQRDGPQLGRVVGSRAVSELPLATRNFTQILGLSTGAATYLPDSTFLGRNTQTISVNGARVTQNSFQLNGVDATTMGTAGAILVAVPAPET